MSIPESNLLSPLLFVLELLFERRSILRIAGYASLLESDELSPSLPSGKAKAMRFRFLGMS